MISKIWVLGPAKAGKTTFIQKLHDSKFLIENSLIQESHEMSAPENPAHVYVILPQYEELKKRRGEDPKTDYEAWLSFFMKYSSIERNTTLVSSF
jgi:GTPase SAR1 family protein